MLGLICRDNLLCPHDLNFPELYINSLNFCWPFPDEAIFTSEDCSNDRPRLSNLFKKYAGNIQNWWIAEEFFMLYGGLRPLFASEFVSRNE